MSLWLRLSATFHEHPKMLAVRASAGSKADSAELGWYRILMAAKRYGRWSFASEAHLAHVSGPFYRFVPFYRAAKLLDDLTVHDGESYNAVKTDAERKAEQRDRERGSTAERDTSSRPDVTNERDVPRDGKVTLDKREEKEERTDREDTGAPVTEDDPWYDPEGEALTWLSKHGVSLTPGNGYHRALIGAVEQHGVNAVIGMLDRLAEAGTHNGDAKGFVFGAKDALDARTRPKTADLDREERDEERQRTHRKGLQSTKELIGPIAAAIEERYRAKSA